jgi:dienelactone hydrolase
MADTQKTTDVQLEALTPFLQQPILDPETAAREMREFLHRHVPPLTLPADAAAWTAKVGALQQRMLDEVVYRGVPREWIDGETRVEWGDTLPTKGGYSIQKLRYQAVPGLWIPALLYEPEGLRDRVPAILNVNGHVGTPGKAIEYEQMRCINLAKRGMLALHPEWLNCGELCDTEYNHNRLSYLDLCGRSGLAVFYLAMRRGLDVLDAHPHTDRERLVVTGLSGGGWQTIWLSALDARVAASVPVAGHIGISVRIGCREDIGDLEQNPSDMLRVGDYTHLTAMLAPRPAMLIFNEKDDCCFQTARARPSLFDPVVPFYGLYGRTEHFYFHNNTDPGTHNYDQDNRQQFYRFLNEELHPPGERRDAELSAEGEVLSFDALRVGVPADNAGFGALAERLLPSLPHRRWPVEGMTLERWREESRLKLTSILRLPASEPAVTATDGAREAGPNGVQIIRRTLRLGNTWTLPAVELAPDRPEGLAVVVGQKGRGEVAQLVAPLLSRGLRVVVVDLALCGECDPPAIPRSQNAMIMGATGQRLLGVQVSQLHAVATWAARELGTDSLTLAGVGRVGAVIAACAAALAEGRVEELIAVELPASLKLLIEERVEYADCPELFCFGLLEQFDIREILAMTAAAKITLLRPEGGAQRAEQELAPLKASAIHLTIEEERASTR